jgi:hypothetical protein
MLRPVTLHHCHGGTVKALGWHVGIAQKQNPYLQIPLHARYHVGPFGIDSSLGLVTWERNFGTQVEHLEWVCVETGHDVWEYALAWANENTRTSGRSPRTGTPSLRVVRLDDTET